MFKGLKRCIAIVLCSVLAAGALTACGNESKEPETVVEEPQQSGEDKMNETDRKDDGKIRSALTSLEVMELMGGGINLGNTMEATNGRASHGVGADPSVYETSWGQPITTQKMLNDMKAAGFDLIIYYGLIIA